MVKVYNGSVSSYVWTMGDDSRERGYVFDYDALNRLTLARYGEHADISTNPNRYTEKVGLYSTNSMIRRFQRHGLKANGVYGKIDNLHVSLDGNRIKSVLEDAPAVTTPGSMDFAGQTGKESTMTYDAAGNMITDSSRGISLISYDNSNRPISVLFEDGNETRYVYSAAGEKLRTVHLTAVEGVMSAATDGIAPLAEARIISRDTTDYRGSVVYRDGRPDMLLFDGGYVTFDGGVTYHYYTRDYLGSNRAVTNGTTGQVEQTVAYYPFGGVIADLGTGGNMQPYKFSGKELDRTHGLNEYDFSARRYLQSVPTFTQPDELANRSMWLSPYVYCAANPVNRIDPLGLTTYDVDGEIKSIQDGHDNLKIIVSNADFIALQEAYSQGNFQYESLMNDFSVKYGFMISEQCYDSESSVGLGVSITAHKAGGQSYSEWSLANMSPTYNNIDMVQGYMGAVIGGISKQSKNIAFGSNNSLYFRNANTGRIFNGNQYVSVTNLSKVSSLKKVSKGFTRLGWACVGYETYQGYRQDGNTFGYNATLQLSKGLCGIMGAKAGAELGAIIGAGFGGAGAVPGAIIGGIIGSIGGAYGGEWIGSQSAEAVMKKL